MTATAQQLEYLKNSIKSIQDYPKPGILFRDVTSLLEDPKAYALSIDLLVERYKNAGITKVVGTEARGFLFGAPVALGLGVGFVPVRKPGKLPRETISETYDLEYGTDQLEIHVDAIKPGDKVLVVDDLLATGGTIEATVKLIRRPGLCSSRGGRTGPCEPIPARAPAFCAVCSPASLPARDGSISVRANCCNCLSRECLRRGRVRGSSRPRCRGNSGRA